MRRCIGWSGGAGGGPGPGPGADAAYLPTYAEGWVRHPAAEGIYTGTPIDPALYAAAGTATVVADGDALRVSLGPGNINGGAQRDEAPLADGEVLFFRLFGEHRHASESVAATLSGTFAAAVWEAPGTATAHLDAGLKRLAISRLSAPSAYGCFSGANNGVEDNVANAAQASWLDFAAQGRMDFAFRRDGANVQVWGKAQPEAGFWTLLPASAVVDPESLTLQSGVRIRTGGANDTIHVTLEAYARMSALDAAAYLPA